MKFKLFRSLRSKLVLAALIVELCMLSLLIGNSLRLLTNTYSDEAERHISQLIPVLQAALVAPIVQQDWATINSILQESQHLESMDYLAVTLPSGEKVAIVGWEVDKHLPPAEQHLTLEPKPNGDLRYDVQSPLIFAGQNLGTLHLGMDLHQFAEAREQLLIQGSTIAGSEIILTAILMTLLAFWLTRHIRRLQEANTALMEGRFEPIEKSHDEDIDQLITAYNNLGEHIQARQYAEARLQLLASAFEHAQEGFAIFTSHGVIQETNPAFIRLTGYHPTSMPGQNAMQLLSVQNHSESETLDESVWASLRARGNWRGEMLLKRADNSSMTVLATLSSVDYGDDRATDYVGIFADITALKAYQHQLEQLAHYDPLTGLPNRVMLANQIEKSIQRCKEQHSRGAILLLDLDNFKPVNDQYGHDAGDRLLLELSQRLKHSVKSTDTISRMGGDEFVILLNDLASEQEVIVILERLLNRINAPFMIRGRALHMSASFGYTLFPEDSSDADALIRHADQAMYIAKGQGRNRWHRYDLLEETEMQELGRLRTDLRIALNDEQLLLHYQPKIDYRGDVITGVEALIRWQHPELGLLPPGRFLHAINGHDRIEIELSLWVMEHAAQQWLAWHEQGLNLEISINIPATHLHSGRLGEDLDDLLLRHPDLPPQAIELEILETAALGDVNAISVQLKSISAKGFRFAIDDFGTGYASLSYLKHLPVHEIKIDQSFVRDMLKDPDDHAIVEAIIGLSGAFGLEVIAEGVETSAHAEALKTLGCMRAQGYGISRPIPAEDIPVWLASRAARQD